MASKVTCTCGWSWNKSDSSKKDVYVCHQCGKDNTMKNGGWLDKFQEGREKKPITTREDFEPGILSNIPGLTSIASGNQPGYNRHEQYGPLGDLYRYYGGLPLEHNVLIESQSKPAKSKDKNAKYISLNRDPLFVSEVLDNYKRVSSGKLDKGIESKLGDDNWQVSGYSSAGKDAHKTTKQGSEHHSNAIGRYILGKGKDEKGEYISYYDKFDQGTGTGINPGELLGLTKPFEIYDRIYLDPKTGKPKMKNGGWLSKYNTPEAQNGIEGTMAGLTDQGFNYNGAWGGTMAMGGSLPGSVGFTYARTQDPAPSNGPYAKKTKASAQDGKKISYNQWKKQNNLKETSDYNLKRAWELGYTPDKTGHLPTVDNQTGQFLKVKGHPTLKLELDWYNSPEGAEFKSKNTLDSTGKFFKYVPKLQNGQEMKFYQEGLDWKPKNISQWGGDYTLDADQAIQTIVNVGDVMSAPQQGAVKALTGKYQMPSKALGMQEDSWGAEAVDLFTDPSTYLGGSLFKKGIGVASKVASKVGKGASKLSKAAGTFKKDFVQGYKGVPTREDGGIIKDDRGQWEYPGEITKINSNQITMQGVDYPVLGISDTGDTQMMQPGQDYTYEGESVTEYPMMKEGGSTSSKIICPNCGWGWKKSEAGNDPYVCHKCGMNNASKLQNIKKENGGWLSKYN